MPSSSALTDFSEDQLNREYLADYLTTFIRTTLPAVNTNSLVIALNSAWGAGKTSFIHMWMNKLKNRNAKIDDINPNVSENENVLESTQDFNIIYYNAWENDSCPEAIIPIICSFSQLLKEDVSDNAKCEEKKKVILNTIKILGPKVLGSFACRALHIDTEIGKEIVSGITDAASDILTDDIPQTIYDSYSSTQEKKRVFTKLSEEFATEDKPLLIFIDELDRCRPTFAIETLESVKHFFDLPNVIFVFSLDSTQLKKSIQAVYGDIDSVGYLQRFFDYEISLPESSDYRDFLSSRLSIDGEKLSLEASHLTSLTEQLSLSLRDLNVICAAYLKFIKSKPYMKYKIIGDKCSEYRRIYLSLIALKYKDPLRYLDILNNGLSDSEIQDVLWQDLFGHTESSLEKYHSILTKEILATPIFRIMQRAPNSDRDLAFNRVLLIEDYGSINLYKLNITLSQAIMNNVEYGAIHHLVYQEQH